MSIQTAKLKNFASSQTVLGLVLAIIFTLMLEHSAIDVAISQYFYSPTDSWLLAKELLLPNLIFYTIPKRLLIVFEVYMAIAWLQRYLLQRRPSSHWLAKQQAWFKLFSPLSLAEMGYRFVAMVTVIAWLMGRYKMLIGDHFFSHTLVSMSLAWGICAAVAWAWCRCRLYAKNTSAKNS